MFGVFRKKKPAVQPRPVEAIVPRVKHEAFLDAIRGISQEDPNSTPVTRPFVADLLVAYAFDLPNEFIMVSERDRKRLGLSPDVLHEVAMKNLRRVLPSPQSTGVPHLTRLTVGNHLEGCLLLMDDLWDQLSRDVPGRLVAAAPTRDMLMYASSDNAESIKKLRTFIATAVEQERTHCLTQELLQRDAGTWTTFKA